MCYLIVEIPMLIAGIWMLISGKIPSKLFRVLFGEGDYVANAKQARLIGLLLASPIPITFIGSVILTAVYGAYGMNALGGFDLFSGLAVWTLALIVARSIKVLPVDKVG